MIYKIKTITGVHEEKACEHIENNIIKTEDLMFTIWEPVNFKANTYNYFLRRNHKNWDAMHTKRKNVVFNLWLEELNIDPSKHMFVDGPTDAKTGIQDFKIAEINTQEGILEERWEFTNDEDAGVYKL
tara:strand:+ start:276 stop:659 length:384 start_codon:yes stop_codon:yes gene_type:complete